MGIVNVTPDSFSDGGRWLDPEAAIAHGLELAAEGADILDIGGESTRPGADPVSEDEERRRVLPVIAALAERTTAPISVDTMKAGVAAAALDAGATIVNDVTAGRGDPAMLATVAARRAGIVLMHMQGEPRTMQANPHYGDVVAEVTDFLRERVAGAEAAGITRDKIMADPGIGFGKTIEHNVALLARLPELVEGLDGVPVLVGTSRKTFLGRISGAVNDTPDERDDATLASVVWAFERGASTVRVHDVHAAARVARFLELVESTQPEDVYA